MAVHKYESKIGNKLLYVREFDGVHDLSDIAASRVEEGMDRLGNSSIDGDYDFTGTKSLAEAVDLCDKGWPKGVDMMNKAVEAIHIDPELLPNRNTLTSCFDVSGDEPDIDRYLQGEPENMITYSQDTQTYGNVLDIVLNVGQPSYVDKKAIINRGAAVLAAVEALRIQGCSVGVLAVEQCSGNSGVIQSKIPILTPGEAVNVDTLAFATMHPSFLRRLIFAAQETEEYDIRKEFGFYRSGGYGVPLPIKDYKHDRPACIIDLKDGLTEENRQIKKFAQTLAEKCLKTLEGKEI